MADRGELSPVSWAGMVANASGALKVERYEVFRPER